MRPTQTVLSAALLLGLAAVVAGCGSLTAADLTGEADAICRDGQRRFAEIQDQPPADPAEAAKQTDALIRVADDEIARLDALSPPGGIAADYERYLDSRRRGVELMSAGRDAANHKSRKGFQMAQTQAIKLAGKRAKLAKQLGFKICGTGSTSIAGP